MKKPNILTDPSTWNKKEFNSYGTNLLLGCASSNTNFTFIGSTYSLYKTRFNKWVSTNSEGEVSGNKKLIQIADDNLELAKASYKLVAKSVNSQSANNLIKLKSSGGVLNSEGTALGVLPQGYIKKITTSIVGEATITLKTFKKSIGTIVYWRDLTADTIMEHEFFAQKHIIHLDGLISGHRYEIWIAYKGSVRKVIKSQSVKIYIQ
jgi:hypothetical protein